MSHDTLATPVEYVESLRSLEIRACVGGERVGSIVDNRSIAPHINTVAKTYELTHLPEHREVMRPSRT
jgi:aromatic ring hydroxylase